MLTRIFIIGHTSAGKSTYARQLAVVLGKCPIVSGGGWVREAFPNVTDPEGLTNAARAALRSNPDRSLAWVGDRPTTSTYQIVEGIRNPRDFAYLCDPLKDIVVFLRAAGDLPATTWEATGVGAIHKLAAFYAETWDTRVLWVQRQGDRVQWSAEEVGVLVKGA